MICGLQAQNIMAIYIGGSSKLTQKVDSARETM